jgi:hypothetical protein
MGEHGGMEFFVPHAGPVDTPGGPGACVKGSAWRLCCASEHSSEIVPTFQNTKGKHVNRSPAIMWLDKYLAVIFEILS